MSRIILSFIVLVLFSMAAGAIYLWLHRDHPGPAPDLTLLNESLHRSMESELATSSPTMNLVELNVKPPDLDSEIERIKDLAAKLGGSATVNYLPAKLDRDLLVEIPPACARQFVEAVQDRTKLVLDAPLNPDGKNQIIEVKLHATQ
jgi:hypothetical protein